MIGFSLRYYLRFYRAAFWSLLLCAVGLVVQPIVLSLILLMIRYIFDILIVQGKLTFILFMALGIIGLFLISVTVNLWVRYHTLQISHTPIQQFREEILKRLYSFSRLYYNQVDRKRLHTVLMQDMIRVDIMTNAVIGQLVPALIVSATIAVLLCYLQPWLFLATAMVFLLFYLANRLIKPLLRRFIREHHKAFEDLSAKIMFALDALDLTHMRAAQQTEIMQQLSLADRFYLTSLRLVMVREGMGFIQDTMTIVLSLVCLIIGGIMVTMEKMTMGGLLSFYTATLLLRPYLRQSLATLPAIVEGIESLDKLYDLLQVAHCSPYQGRKKIVFSGHIVLDSVSFGYNENSLLRDINLEIKPGQIVGIFGPNGAGKSTIAYLILGFYRPDSGQILADGYPFVLLDMNHLRQFSGVVPQNPFIFSGTIWDNITYGCSEVSEAEVIQAARLATADGFIARLPNQYDTLIGHNGLLLSGGQCQRIALARALLRHPRLLILDEPTNHLDVTAIGEFIENLRQLADRPACLIITHDREVIRQVDCSYLVDQGRIISQINHSSHYNYSPLQRSQSDDPKTLFDY